MEPSSQSLQACPIYAAAEGQVQGNLLSHTAAPPFLTIGQRELQASWEAAPCSCLHAEEAQVRVMHRDTQGPTGLKETCSQMQTHSPRTVSDAELWPVTSSSVPRPCAEEMGQPPPTALSQDLSQGLSSLPGLTPAPSSIPVGECRPSSACHIHCPGRAVTQKHTGIWKENREGWGNLRLESLPEAGCKLLGLGYRD